MATAPYGVRLLVGAATVAIEETRKLPQIILMYPVTLASQAAHLFMRCQQSLAELVIKGDSTLETLFPPKDEQPEWARFDEDESTADSREPGEAEPDTETEADRAQRSGGRFALYSLHDAENPTAFPDETKTTPTHTPSATALVPAPSVAVKLDYGSLTLAQLRARLRTLNTDELQALLAYEEATTARAPFQTLLANRIIRTTAK